MVSVSLARDPYAEMAMRANSDFWPDAGRALLDELAASRDRFALVNTKSEVEADVLIHRLAVDLDLPLLHLGRALEGRRTPPTTTDVEVSIGRSTIVTDLDLLFWPECGIPVLPLLTTIARRQPLIAVWPGEISAGRARYSSPGRPDHLDELLNDVLALCPRSTRFPDEVPYDIERITP